MNELIIKTLETNKLTAIPFLLESPWYLECLYQRLSKIDSQQSIGYDFPKKEIEGKIAANSEVDPLQEFYSKLEELYKIANDSTFCVSRCNDLLTRFFDLVNNLSIIDDDVFIEVLKQIIELLLQNKNKFVKFAGLYIFACCKKYGCSILSSKEINSSLSVKTAFVELEMYLTQNPFAYKEDQPKKLQTAFENYTCLFDFDLIIDELSYCSELIAGINLKVSSQYKKAEIFIQAVMTGLMIEVKTLKAAILEIYEESRSKEAFIIWFGIYLKNRATNYLQSVNSPNFDIDVHIININSIELTEILSASEQDYLYLLAKKISEEESIRLAQLEKLEAEQKASIDQQEALKAQEKKLFKNNLDIAFRLKPFIEKFISTGLISGIAGVSGKKSDIEASLQEISNEIVRLVEIANKNEGKIACYDEATMTFAAWLNRYSPFQLVKRNLKIFYSGNEKG